MKNHIRISFAIAIQIALFLSLGVRAVFGANVEIRNLTTTVVLPASNTFLIVDGATQGTGKTLMANLGQITGTRATLVALSVTGISTGVSVQTLGGSTIGDGAGSLYYYSSTSTATPNGTTILQPTVGSGRWLIVTNSAIPAPTTVTLGGVFSKAAASHFFLTGIGTDGMPSAATPTAADISGLGTMSLQAASAVAITGGTLSGMTSYAGGSAALTTGLSLTTAAGDGAIVIAGATSTNRGLKFQTGSSLRWQQTASNSPESGSNQGSNWQLISYDDTGAALRTDFFVNRQTGAAFIGGNFRAVGGIDNTVIGATTPLAANFTTTSWSSNPNIRTTKGNLHLTQINVKDFGATGNGSTDDTASINSAIAALTNYSSLYFPPGKYRIASALSAFSSLNTITVWGEGAEIFNDTGAAGGNTFVFNSSCSSVEVCGLRFTGSSSIRASGIHLRMYASNSTIHNNYLQGCSDFAIHVSNSGSAYTSNVIVADNIINGPLGDGIHVGNAATVTITGNNIINTGDDGIGIVADSVSFPPNNVTIVGNSVTSAGSDGIRLAEANDVLVEGNSVRQTVGAGIEVNRYLSTTAYNNRIHILGNKLWNTQTSLGPRGSIWINFVNESSVVKNEIYDSANGAAIAILDFNDLTIQGNIVRGSPVRGIVTDDTTTANVAVNWYGLVLKDNIFQYVVANEAIYVVPPPGVTLNNMMITHNVANQVPAGNWIFYSHVNTGKVDYNTSRDTRGIAAGGSVSGVTQLYND